MYFSRIRVLGSQPDKLMTIIKSNDYDQHQLLWTLFPNEPDADRDFLFKRDEERGFPQFYMVSAREPISLAGILDVKTKGYQPQIETGDRLAFTLRANPVRTRKVDDYSKKRKRDDVVMLLKNKYKTDGVLAQNTPSKAALSQEAGEQWLNSRAERCGFELEVVRADSYIQHRFTRKSREIRYSSMDFQGTLSVIDPEKFTYTLINGIGPAKAFGCGLMLVRRS